MKKYILPLTLALVLSACGSEEGEGGEKGKGSVSCEEENSITVNLTDHEVSGDQFEHVSAWRGGWNYSNSHNLNVNIVFSTEEIEMSSFGGPNQASSDEHFQIHITANGPKTGKEEDFIEVEPGTFEHGSSFDDGVSGTIFVYQGSQGLDYFTRTDLVSGSVTITELTENHVCGTASFEYEGSTIEASFSTAIEKDLFEGYH